MADPLWQPGAARIAQTGMDRFRRLAASRHRLDLPDYAALYRWSIEQPEAFWSLLWEECGVVAQRRGERVLVDGDRMPGARWFPDARLNFAENLLRRRDDGIAVLFRDEQGTERSLTHGGLYDRVSQLEQALRAMGIGPGDRIAGYLPNLPETLIAMLASASIGATWSSCSPDFGVDGVVDRFGQIGPRLLIAADGYFYNGRHFDCLEKVAAIRQRIPSLERTLIVDYTGGGADGAAALADTVTLEQFTAPFQAGDIEFEQLPFDHPLYILFSSGTTGTPKCIVHGAGGTLLQHLKEHRLHCDIRPDDRVFYFTTCGWMMWNWLASALASGATLLLYDGSPFHPDGNILFDYAEQTGMTLFGTSAKYIDALRKAGLSPRHSHDLSSLRTLCSTGSPLLPEAFDYVYQEIKQDLCLSSISGGTDIVSCFALGNPVLPVWRGELQCRGLGMKVEVWDDQGRPLHGEKGELVCTAPFPSMPVGFWNDADGSRYRAAYFERFPGVWCHGDYVELTDHDGLIVYGRSDAVLNPGGVRIGTAEIYRQVEQLEEVVESIVIGQEWEGDVRVVLFVQLREGLTLDQDLSERIRQRIRANTTPRHVPARVLQVDAIPRTRSGKIVELAVRDVVHGRPVRNLEALANPEALDQFADREELRR
ncbi:MAG TPA: acetoacetate--CoA ligase [Sedimenticola thiotaurini]|uniref:Acetoacetate--CoA ligase n=1 Tax=Sedimenticola thiotaurini TaxID=1543721 RepID=A0A831RLM4_9GAMM|nr:acetoacetate--CoA ligase [Sedimenticola thiotaurini]